MKKITVAILGVACVLALNGCRKGAETLAEKIAERNIKAQGGGDAKVDIKDGQMSIKTKDGEMVAMSGAGAKVPADFPKDVFVPKNAKVIASVKVPEGFTVTFESKDAQDKVLAEASAAMKASGWAEMASMNMGDQSVLSYAKESEDRAANVMVSRGEGSTQILITSVKNQK